MFFVVSFYIFLTYFRHTLSYFGDFRHMLVNFGAYDPWRHLEHAGFSPRDVGSSCWSQVAFCRAQVASRRHQCCDPRLDPEIGQSLVTSGRDLDAPERSRRVPRSKTGMLGVDAKSRLYEGSTLRVSGALCPHPCL